MLLVGHTLSFISVLQGSSRDLIVVIGISKCSLGLAEVLY